MSKGPIDELSEREQEILRLIATGASNKEIAQQLFISANTVMVHLRNIFAKIGVASRTEAAMYAVRMGISPSGAVIVSEPEVVENASESEVGLRALTDETGQTFEKGQISAPESIEKETFEKPSTKVANLKRRFGFPAWVWMAGAIGLLLIMVGIYVRSSSTEPLAVTPSTATLEPTQVRSRWTKLAPAPVLRQGLAVAAFESVLYVVGGEAGNKILPNLDRYQDEDDTWTSLADKPLAVTDVAAVVVGGKIIVPGGRTASGQPTEVVEIYHPNLDSWSQCAPLPAPRSAYALSVWEGQVYLFGGWDGTEYTRTVFRYDITADQWIELTPMPTGRGFEGVVNANGKFFVFGGWDGTHALAINEVYQPAQENSGVNPWSSAASLPAPRYAFGSAGIAYFVYALGGLDDSQNEPAPVQYNTQNDEWITFTAPDEGLGAHLGVAVLETNLHVFSALAHYSYEAVKIVVIPLISP